MSELLTLETPEQAIDFTNVAGSVEFTDEEGERFRELDGRFVHLT